MLEIVGTIITVIAVAGVILNNRMRRECFILWLISNLVSALIHISVGVWSLAARDLIFFVLAIDGFIRWGRR